MDHSSFKSFKKRMWFLNSLKRITYLSTESLDYIKRYQLNNNRLSKEAKKRENNRFILRGKQKQCSK